MTSSAGSSRRRTKPRARGWTPSPSAASRGRSRCSATAGREPPVDLEPPEPFAGLTPAGVQYVSAVDRGGATFHRLQVVDPVPALERFLAPLVQNTTPRLEVLSATLEVVAADGTAHEASLTMQGRIQPCSPGQACDGQVAQKMSMSLRYAFSQWGSDFEILRPAG